VEIDLKTEKIEIWSLENKQTIELNLDKCIQILLKKLENECEEG